MIKLIKIIYFIILSFYFLFFPNVNAQEKIKIGLLVPMTGENKVIGESIIKAVGLAVKDIDNDLIEIYPKDTATKANQTLKSAFELSEMGIKIVIGPVFYESLTYLDEMKDLTFLSLTNKTLDLPKNVISAGINSTSQFNTIKKFLETNQIQRTIFLTPIQDYEFEVKRGMKNSKIKIFNKKALVIDMENKLRCFSLKTGDLLWSVKTQQSLLRSQKKQSLILNNDNAFFISPPKLDKRASNIRFISSLDNELSNLEKVFDKLDLELKDNRIQKVRNLVNKELDYKEDAEKFLIAFRERLDLLAIYKNALEFIPLKPPMEHYYVTSKYGKRKHPVTKKWRFHHGIDLAGTWQENIRVSADGVVTFAGYHGSFGKVIRIRHNYGIRTTYGHLAKILVKKGQIVSEGQVIGKMGRTGRVDGAHLHYEISVNGKSEDPAIYFSIGRKLLSRNSLKSIADIN